MRTRAPDIRRIYAIRTAGSGGRLKLTYNCLILCCKETEGAPPALHLDDDQAAEAGQLGPVALLRAPAAGQPDEDRVAGLAGRGGRPPDAEVETVLGHAGLRPLKC